MFSFDPAQRVHILLVAVVDGLVTGALRVNVDHGVDETGLSQARGQGNRAKSGVCTRKSQLRRRSARADHQKVLTATDPTGTETVRYVVVHLPVKSGGEAVATEVGITGIDWFRVT